MFSVLCRRVGGKSISCIIKLLLQSSMYYKSLLKLAIGWRKWYCVINSFLSNKRAVCPIYSIHAVASGRKPTLVGKQLIRRSLLIKFRASCTRSSQLKGQTFGENICLSPFGLLYQNATDWMAYKQHKFISHVLEAGSPRSRHRHGHVWVRALFLVHSWHLSSVSSLGRRV